MKGGRVSVVLTGNSNVSVLLGERCYQLPPKALFSWSIFTLPAREMHQAPVLERSGLSEPLWIEGGPVCCGRLIGSGIEVLFRTCRSNRLIAGSRIAFPCSQKKILVAFFIFVLPMFYQLVRSPPVNKRYVFGDRQERIISNPADHLEILM